MSKLEVTIVNFETYKGRADVKHNSWFRCSNRLLEDPDFFDFSHEEILVWIYILSLGSQKNSHKVTINYHHANSVARLSTVAINSAVRKLKKLKALEASTLRGRYVRDTETCSTRQDITDKTRQDRQESSDESAQLVDFWNSQNWDLPKVSKLTQERKKNIKARLSEASLDEWKAAIERIHKSQFLLGKTKKSTWRASFDWLIEDESNFLKIIEGRYDTKDALSDFDPMTAPLRGTP